MAKSRKRVKAEPVPAKPAPKAKLVFSQSADRQLRKLPAAVQNGLKKKLRDYAFNPELGKPLTGALQGFDRVTNGRVRAITKASLDAPVAVIVVAAIRKEGDRDDVYELALAALANGGNAEITNLLARTVRAFLLEQRPGPLLSPNPKKRK